MINYDEKIFGKVDNYIIPQQGDLLISSPLMTESTFRHTVILLAEVDADNSGACTGFVMNRCSNTELSDVIDFENVPSGVRVYIGGPVSNDHLFFIHGYGSMVRQAQQISEGLYWGGRLDDLLEVIHDDTSCRQFYRFFVGYSGWSYPQLNQELLDDFWAIEQYPLLNSLFSTPEEAYWHTHVKCLGSMYKHWLYHPFNPLDN